MRCEPSPPPAIARHERTGVTAPHGSASRARSAARWRGAVLAAVLLAASCGQAWAQGDAAPSPPGPETADKLDWVQMTSGEWLRGEIISLYDEVLEFDSEEFEDLELEWEDI